MTKNPTQREIAQLAGVAQATVSFVLSGHGEKMKITPQVIDKIQRIAKDLGYVPNHNARSLVTGRCYTLGAMMYSSQGNPFWALVAAGVHARALDAGYDVTLIPAQLSAEEVINRYVRNRRIDAVIILNTDAPTGAWDLAPLPPVSLSFRPLAGAPHVCLDLSSGVQQAVDHLVEQGHRSALYVEEAAMEPYGRAAVWQAAGAQRQLDIRVVRLATSQTRERLLDRHVANLREAMLPVLRERGQATAVLGFNDLTGLAAQQAARQLGLRVPQDLSVVGFDDREAPFCDPPMTAVSHEFGPLGAAAAQVAVDLVDGTLSVAQARQLVQTVPSRLVVRASTGPAPGR